MSEPIRPTRFTADQIQSFLASIAADADRIRPRVLGDRIRVRTGGNVLFTGVIVDVQPGPLRYTARAVIATFRVTLESALGRRETFILRRIPPPLR